MADPLELRFRNQASDGRSATSEVLHLEHAVPPPPRLGTPGFGCGSYQPGDQASISADAGGLQRGAITFVIEKQAGGAWQQAASIAGTIAGGQAFARWQVPEQPDAAEVLYRPRAVAAFGQTTGEPCSVRGAPRL